MNSVVPLKAVAAAVSGTVEQLVTFRVDDQHFGIPAMKVRDVLRQQPLTPVPLARPEIAGAMNLRGHIVTAIDLRARLGAPPAAADAPKMCVVVEKGGEPYCLVVDAVGDVIAIDTGAVEPNPASLPAGWAQIARGLFRMNERLLLLLDVDQLLTW
jgi:purine-binding chemotaxis protein CheW